jgi:hypothetical protein
MGTGVLCRGQGDLSVKFAMHRYLLMMLKMNGAIRLLSVYAFMASTGSTVYFIFLKIYRGYVQIEGDVIS